MDEAATKKQGPVSRAERELYRARTADDVAWGRPEHGTGEKLAALLGVDLLALRVPRETDAGRVAGQAFVVALDTILRLGDRGEKRGHRLTRNTLFDALARRWSRRYRRARRRGAGNSYDLKRGTIRRAWRELMVAGVNVDALWDLLVRQVEVMARRESVPPHAGLAQLYTLRRAYGRGHAGGGLVELRDGPLLDEVRAVILSDTQYRHPRRWRLLLADDRARALPTRHQTCQERPYDVVRLGGRSRDVLAILESARVRFYVEQFREDFEYLADFVVTRAPQTTRQRHGHAAVRSVLAGWRQVYEQTAGIGDLQRDVDGRAYVTIRSRFFRAVNRRFHAHDFWPEHVPGDLRGSWFGPDDLAAHGSVDDPANPDRSIEINEEWTQPFIERDVSSSQTQLVAAFLGLDDLEAVAGSRDPKFKVYLARQLWALHERENVLASGYSGPDDARLVAFIKELWMRRNYGGKFGETVLDLAHDPAEYGPGWNSPVLSKGGIRRAETFWGAFLASLPEWSRAVDTFLQACTYIGRHADPRRGVILTDPLDGARVRWNPIRRAPLAVPAGKGHLELRPSGQLLKAGAQRRFVPLRWQVNLSKLGNRVAPCVVHTLDAYFNALVLEYLAGRGITQIVAVHDGWFVPATVETDLLYDDFVPLSGEQVLALAIEYVGPEWLSGVGRIPKPDKELYYYWKVPPDPTRPGIAVVYDWFVTALTGTEYEAFAVDVRDRWRARVAAHRWPKFTAS